MNETEAKDLLISIILLCIFFIFLGFVIYLGVSAMEQGEKDRLKELPALQEKSQKACRSVVELMYKGSVIKRISPCSYLVTEPNIIIKCYDSGDEICNSESISISVIENITKHEKDFTSKKN
jgi:hypothetical protein